MPHFLLHSLLPGLLAGFTLSLLWPHFPLTDARIPALFLAGLFAYALIDRTLHPICAVCEKHAGNDSWWPLAFLTLALAAHSFLDGAMLASSAALRWPILLHWLPEAVAVGSLLCSVARRGRAIAAFLLIQSAVPLGYFIAHTLPHLAELALLATGALAYMALHGLHESYVRQPRSLLATSAVALFIFLILAH